MNIYSVLDSDEDEKPKQSVKKTAPAAAAPAAAPAAKAADNKAQAPKSNNNNKGPRNATTAEFESAPEREKPKRDTKNNHHSRHGAKNHHEGEDAAPRKRVFDRRSSNGRGKEVSKDGAGAANWGNEKNEALKAEKRAAADTEDVVVEDAVVEDAEPESPPEPTVFTLDEYNKKRAEARSQNDAFAAVEIRKVTDDFSGLKTKSEDDTVFIALGSSKAAKGKKEQRSASKTAVDVAFTVAPSEPVSEPRGERPERGGRGGRGGDRAERPKSGRGGDRPRSEGRGRGGAERSGKPAAKGPKVDFSDANAFPAL